MGKIKSQGVSNTMWTYIGLAAGGIYSIFIIPKAFGQHPEFWGFIQFLVYYMQVFLPLAQLGMPNTIIRFNSKVNNEELPKFYGFSIAITLLMTLIVSLGYFQLGPYLANTENKGLFSENFYWLIPMLIGAAFFETLSAISKASLKSKVPVFLKESLPKIYTLLLMTLYWVHPFSFDVFLALYAAIYALQLILITGYLLIEYGFRPKLDFGFFRITLAKQMYPYMLLSVLLTSAALWSTKVDILMIGYLLNLQEVAYYSIALYMATLIVIPFRSLSSIAVPLVAGYWTHGQKKDIDTVLKKVSEVSLVAGSFIFLIIWFNIDWIMAILGNKFGDIKWVFFVIGLSRLVDGMFSINGGIILTSKYYKIDILFQLILVSLGIVLNLWLIPLFNLEGAAIATLASLIIYNLLKWLYLFSKFNFSPFTRSTIISIFLLIGFFSLTVYKPFHLSFIANALVSLVIIPTVFLGAIYFLNLSNEIKDAINKLLKKSSDKE